ncbi:MAG: hypothetical protein COA78_24955 [Blastopirellula sp.]|nr:MAG: hypothetical protein COA78_24955 [Blastopirellula sp.]
MESSKNKSKNDQVAGLLRPPTFTLRALSIAIALLCIVLAVMHYLGPMASFVFVLFVLAVFAHVAGAYIGDRLKQRPKGTQPSDKYPDFDPIHDRPLTDEHFAPTTTLGHTGPVTLWIRYAIVVAVVIGGLLGAYASSWVDPAEFNYAVLGLCCLSGAALAGIFAFTISSFLEQLLSSWIQASRESSRR